MYEIYIKDAAKKALKKTDLKVINRIISKIEWLSENIENIQLETLSGEYEQLFKLRIGDYSVLYEVDYKNKIIIVHLVGHRKEIYK